MAVRMVTIQLPEAIYQQAERTAAVASLSLEEVLVQLIALSLHSLNENLLSEIRANPLVPKSQSDESR
jgi:hypothetical protein